MLCPASAEDAGSRLPVGDAVSRPMHVKALPVPRHADIVGLEVLPGHRPADRAEIWCRPDRARWLLTPPAGRARPGCETLPALPRSRPKRTRISAARARPRIPRGSLPRNRDAPAPDEW